MSESVTVMGNGETVEYRSVTDFPGYRVGNDGSVWSCWKATGLGVGNGPGRVVFMTEQWRRLKPRSGDGVPSYPNVDLWRDGKPYTRKVHLLVLNAFVGPVPTGMEACHTDGNRANNHVGNLRWDTHLNNVRDQVLHGTRPVGSSHWNAKLDEATVRHMMADYATGKIGYRRLAKKYGLTMKGARSVVLGKTWKHVT